MLFFYNAIWNEINKIYQKACSLLTMWYKKVLIMWYRCTFLFSYGLNNIKMWYKYLKLILQFTFRPSPTPFSFSPHYPHSTLPILSLLIVNSFTHFLSFFFSKVWNQNFVLNAESCLKILFQFNLSPIEEETFLIRSRGKKIEKKNNW